MVLVIATAGLVYELVMAAVASYLLGDSVTQFSIVIGLYLSALGIGAYISRYIDDRLELTFVDVELTAALIGGLCGPGLFLAFSYTSYFHAILYGTVLGVGVLVGLELPLLIRILERELAFKDLIARALTFDYAGALLGSLGFSLLLVPKLGLVKSSLLCGFLNALVGFASTWVFRPIAPELGRQLIAARARAVIVLLLLVIAWFESERVLELAEHHLYGGRVLAERQSQYQRIVLVERAGTVQLFLNGNLQFSAADEARYHEALVHPVMAASAAPRRVLIGGGGDGLALREVLKWPAVQHVTLVDLDREMTALAAEHPALKRLNRNALADRRVRVVNTDAMIWFAEAAEHFDVVILDFPDPTNYALGKLYSTRFYAAAVNRLAEGGTLAVQATSPLFARRAYWCIVRTLQASGLTTLPYHVFVPSFGEWGFVLAKRGSVAPPEHLQIADVSYLDAAQLRGLFVFPRDMDPVPTEVNRLNNQALVGYYLKEWDRWN